MTIEREAAKPKRPRDLEFEDAPRQESIRGLSPRTIKRNPSADQKRVRREMQRKTASQESPLADALIKAASDSPFGDWTCATPGCNKYDGMSAFRGDKYCKSCMKAGEPDKQREAEQRRKRSSKKTASKCETCGNSNFTEGGSCTRCGRSKTASAAGTYAGPSPTGGYHHWMSVDSGDEGHDSEDQCISCGVVTPDVADKDSAFSDHGALPLGCPGPKGAYNAHHFTHMGDGELDCAYCGHQVKNDTKPSDVEWESLSHDRGPIPADHPNAKRFPEHADYPGKPLKGLDYHGSKTATLPLPLDVPTNPREPELGDHKCQQCDYSGAPVLSQAGGYSCRNCGSYAINKIKKQKTANYPWYSQEHHISAECKPGGSGQCDGYDYDQNDKSCDCHCHTTSDLPNTIEGVKDWHDDYHGIEAKASKTAGLKVAGKGIGGLEDGDELRYSHPDHPDYEFKVTYHPREAIGDNGQPARGYVKGGFEVTYPNGKTKYHDHGPFRPGKDMNSKSMVAQSIESDIIGKIHRNHLQSKRYGDREASLQAIATQFDTQADRLNPGDQIRTPTGQTVKVLRMRNHETSGNHVYMDTDQGTSVVRRKSPVSIVPHNSQQQELPGYGTPGGNTNQLPMDAGNVGPSKQTPGGSNAPKNADCPVCGGKGTLHRQGQNYVCSKCGYRENFGAAGPGEGYNFTDMTQQLRGQSSLSAIARRAQEVLEATKEIQ